MSTTRRRFSIEFKTKVALEAIKEIEPLEVLAKKYQLQTTQISLWKSHALSNFSTVFTSDKKQEKKPEIDIQNLYAQIGQQKVEIDFLKKKLK